MLIDSNSAFERMRHLSRRRLLAAASLLPLSLTAGPFTRVAAVPDQGLSSLPIEFQQVMAKPLYQFSRWQIFIADLHTGEPLYDFNGRDLVVPGSVTKLFPGAAALDAFGPNYRFQTPVYRT